VTGYPCRKELRLLMRSRLEVSSKEDERWLALGPDGAEVGVG
jgi:hypothetical protein